MECTARMFLGCKRGNKADEVHKVVDISDCLRLANCTDTTAGNSDAINLEPHSNHIYHLQHIVL